MGMSMGKITVKTPKYEAIYTAAEYEIRKYSAAVVAEVTYDLTQFRGNIDGNFTMLANYIGTLGEPQYSKPEKIAMTVPAVTRDTPSEVAVQMYFIMLSKYALNEKPCLRGSHET